MHDNNPSQKTLGPASADLIQKLLRSGRRIFTLSDAAEITHKSKHSTTRFISELVKRNIIARLNAGTYLILETSHETSQLTNWPVIAKAITDSEKYYISYYAAMRIHGMTTHATTTIKISINKRRRKKIINNIHYEFIYCKPENFWGIESYWPTKDIKVNVSDLEKTIVEGLLRPEYCGGISEVATGIWLKQNDIDWIKLLGYLKKSSVKSAVKRLGYLLEHYELAPNWISDLRQLIGDSNDYVLLDPKGPKQGKHLKRWHLRINEELSKR